MKQHKKCQDLSKIKPGAFNLDKGDKKLKVYGYSCSKLMTSVNVLLQGENWNSHFETRNALMTAILMDTGTLISKDKHFLFKIQHKFQRRTRMKFFQSKSTSKTKTPSLLFLEMGISWASGASPWKMESPQWVSIFGKLIGNLGNADQCLPMEMAKKYSFN